MQYKKVLQSQSYTFYVHCSVQCGSYIVPYHPRRSATRGFDVSTRDSIQEITQEDLLKYRFESDSRDNLIVVKQLEQRRLLLGVSQFLSFVSLLSSPPLTPCSYSFRSTFVQGGEDFTLLGCVLIFVSGVRYCLSSRDVL